MGVTTTLKEFKDVVDDPDAPITLLIAVQNIPLVNRAFEAQALRDALMAPLVRSRAAELLDLDTPAGKIQLGLGVGGLFASGLAMAVPLLLTSLAVTATGNAWDTSPAGQQGAVARAGRLVAAVSTDIPVAVLIDNADRLDPDLATAMIDNLASRYEGRVLVVAVAESGSTLVDNLLAPGRYGLLGRVIKADADPDMSAPSRAALTRELCPWLPDVAVERIAQRTKSFAEVIAVTAADRLTDLQATSDQSTSDIVDIAINTTVTRERVSKEATVIAWAGGALSAGQVDRVLDELGVDRQQDDPWVIRSGNFARLRDPGSPRLAEQVDGLTTRLRRRLASIMLDEAVRIARGPARAG